LPKKFAPHIFVTFFRSSPLFFYFYFGFCFVVLISHLAFWNPEKAGTIEGQVTNSRENFQVGLIDTDDKL